MSWGVATALAVAAFALSGIALGASTFTDAAGDNNEAPDIVSVTVSDASDTTVSVAVAVANYQTLPPSTWLNLWFDLDSNPATGDAGDEALVRYTSEGLLEHYRWNGSDLVARPTDGMSAAYDAGSLTVTAQRSALGATAGFGLLVVASHGQQVDSNEYTAADFAPDTGRSAYAGPGPTAFPDAGGDHPAAPDVTSVHVSDTKSGMLSFAITTPNFVTLPDDALVLLLVDADGRSATGSGGADVLVLYQAGEVVLGRWDDAQEEFLADEPPTRVGARNAGGVLTLLVHRSELGGFGRIGFAVGAGHIDADDLFDALDIAPESQFWRYSLVFKPPLRLLAGDAKSAPLRPAAGQLVSVTVPVTRSDTGRPIAAGTATCTVRVGGKRIAASGRVASGKGRCAFRLPARSEGLKVTGSIAVRSAGKTVTTRFSFLVR